MSMSVAFKVSLIFRSSSEYKQGSLINKRIIVTHYTRGGTHYGREDATNGGALVEVCCIAVIAVFGIEDDNDVFEASVDNAV